LIELTVKQLLYFFCIYYSLCTSYC